MVCYFFFSSLLPLSNLKDGTSGYSQKHVCLTGVLVADDGKSHSLVRVFIRRKSRSSARRSNRHASELATARARRAEDA